MVQQHCRISLWDHQCGVSLWEEAGGVWEENAGTEAAAKDPSCCYDWFSLLSPACSWCCLTLAALCFGVCVMICSGKHRAEVRISFLEDGEGSVLLTGGRGRVRQARLGRASMSWASRGRSEDNFGLCGQVGRRSRAGDTPETAAGDSQGGGKQCENP